MPLTKANPSAGYAGAALNIKVPGRAVEEQRNSLLDTESLAAAIVAARFRLLPATAKVVCELSGLGRRRA